jgi:hypothetical protein
MANDLYVVSVLLSGYERDLTDAVLYTQDLYKAKKYVLDNILFKATVDKTAYGLDIRQVALDYESPTCDYYESFECKSSRDMTKLIKLATDLQLDEYIKKFTMMKESIVTSETSDRNKMQKVEELLERKRQIDREIRLMQNE